MKRPLRWRIDGEPDFVLLDAIAGVVRDGGVVIIPTDTLYGLHASAVDANAIARIQACKVREGPKPLIVLCASLAQAIDLGVEIDESTRAALDAIWPAPLTAILPLREPVAASCGARTIGVRVPASSWLRELATLAGPVASTSVNYAGQLPATSVDTIPHEIVERVDGIADAGVLEGQPSTIVSFCNDAPTVIRAGSFDFSQELWKKARKSL